MTVEYRQETVVKLSGVTTTGEVRQLPQGAKRQGALMVNRLFALHYRI